MVTSVGLLGALQVVKNRLKDCFAVFLVVAEVGDQPGNAGEVLVVLAIDGEVVSRAHERDDFPWNQSLERNRVSLDVAGARCQDGIDVQAFYDSRERVVITGC